MTIILVFAGLFVASLFALAGFRATNKLRHRSMSESFVYRGKVAVLYDQTRTTCVASAVAMLDYVAVARSAPARRTVLSGSRLASM